MKARLFSPPRSGRIMAAAAVGVALLACGAIAARSGTATALPGIEATTRPCATGQLRAVVDRSAVRHTTYGTEVPIDFIDQWREECVLRGYMPVTGVSTTASHNAHAARIRGESARVTLAEYYTAHIWVLIAKAPGGPNPGDGAAGCRQLTGKGLRVGLPDTTDHVWVPYPFTACAGAGQALLSVRPVREGLANPASFP